MHYTHIAWRYALTFHVYFLKSGKHLIVFFFKQRSDFCREWSITTRCLLFSPQQAEYNPGTCCFNLSACNMAADNALQVVVAAGECTHLIFLLSQNKSNSKTYSNSYCGSNHTSRYCIIRAGCCKLGFKWVVQLTVQKSKYNLFMLIWNRYYLS